MKQWLLIISLFLSGTGNAQRYSRLVKDTAILHFMTWLLQTDTSVHTNRWVKKELLKLNINTFFYADSVLLRNYQFAQNIFRSEIGLKQYFSKEDADYFVKQVKAQRNKKWRFKINKVTLRDENNQPGNVKKPAVYGYSLPLFSANGRYVILVETYYCGITCGEGNYYLYERQPGNNWIKIRGFNHWDQ